MGMGMVVTVRPQVAEDMAMEAVGATAATVEEVMVTVRRLEAGDMVATEVGAMVLPVAMAMERLMPAAVTGRLQAATRAISNY